MAAGRGVCQDHAHIFIGLARTFGIPARYVSGYLMMDDRIDQEAGHAWAEAFVDGLPPRADKKPKPATKKPAARRR